MEWFSLGKQSVSRRAWGSRQNGKEICGETERRGGADRLYSGQLSVFGEERAERKAGRATDKRRVWSRDLLCRGRLCLSAICFVKEAGETTRGGLHVESAIDSYEEVILP